MREIYRSGVTPQQKLVSVNNRFGNTDIKFQQGTTRCLYDTLPLTTATKNLKFFEDSASRNFPLSNTGSDGNKLGVGETMIIEQILFTTLQIDPVTGRLLNLSPNTIAFNDGLYSVVLGNQTVIKNFPTISQNALFNKKSNGVSSCWYGFETAIAIPPLISFTIDTVLGNFGTVAENTLIRCYILGTAGILAPRNTF